MLKEGDEEGEWRGWFTKSQETFGQVITETSYSVTAYGTSLCQGEWRGWFTKSQETFAWVGVKNFGFTEKQKNIEQGSTKLKVS